MKVGIIRCLQNEDICPGTTDFLIARNNQGVFENTNESIEIIGFSTCGGCPGKKAVSRAELMVKKGAEAIVFASCITKGVPIGFPCPHSNTIIEAVRKKLGSEVKIIEGTH